MFSTVASTDVPFNLCIAMLHQLKTFLLTALGQIFIEYPVLTVKIHYWNLDAGVFVFYVFTDDF